MMSRIQIIQKWKQYATLFFVLICSTTDAFPISFPVERDLRSDSVQLVSDSLRGLIVDSLNLCPIRGVNILCYNERDSLVAQTTSDINGFFALSTFKEPCSLLITRIGFFPCKKDYDDVAALPQQQVTFKLKPASTYAGNNQLLQGSLAKGSLDDITLMNNKIALKIEDRSTNTDATTSTYGNPIDFCAIGKIDGFDWINLPLVSKTKITGFSGFFKTEVMPVKYTSVKILKNSPDSSVVMTQGKSIDLPLDVTNTYSIYPEKEWVNVTSTLANTSNDILVCWIGDALDNDEEGQTSIFPNSNTSIDVIADRDIMLRDYEPARPWMGCFGSSNQVFGVFYEDEFANEFEISANTYRIISQRKTVIPPHEKVSFTRKLAAVSVLSNESKNQVISRVYATVTDPNKIETSITTSDTAFLVGKTFTAKIKLKNLSTSTAYEHINVVIKPPFSVSTPIDTVEVPYIEPNGSDSIYLELTPTEGSGNCLVKVETFADDTYKSSGVLRLFVPGKGWYAGEGHSHSYYSDGVNAIWQNIDEAKLKGLSFLHCTDHNIVSQKYAIRKLKLVNFLGITGSEVTTLSGHALSLFCDELIPWDSLRESRIEDLQKIIDNINKAKQGTALSVIAHPYQIGYSWRWTDVVNMKGYEVMNGFNSFRSFETTFAFKLWDKNLKEGKRIYGYANSDAHVKEMIGKLRLMVLMDELTEKALYNATKSGRFYGTSGPDLRFSIDSVQMGDSLSVSSKQLVTISMTAYSYEGLDSVRLIKNGNIFKKYEYTTYVKESNINVVDEAIAGDYYRMEVMGKLDQVAFSNPIFITDKPFFVDSIRTNEETLVDKPTHAYLYPNPATDEVTVNFGKTTSGILNIFDINGVLRNRVLIENKKEHVLDIRSYPKGIYQVQLNDLHLKLIIR